MDTVSRAEMREIDRKAVEEFGMSTDTLMEFAGFQVADFFRNEFSENVKIAVICGPGHNGGDGLVAARRLDSWGFEVVVHVIGEEISEISGDKLEAAGKNGVEISKTDFPTANIYIDAMVGYNLDSPPREPVKSAVEKINKWSAETVAIDVPTGVDVDTGERFNPHVEADYTVSLGMPKKKLYPRNSGDIYLADIGIPRKAVESAGVESGDYFREKSFIEYMTSENRIE